MLFYRYGYCASDEYYIVLMTHRSGVLWPGFEPHLWFLSYCCLPFSMGPMGFL